MKKATSILFLLIILVTGLQITVSQHFCRGNLADTRISLDGSIASCGMENADDNPVLPWDQMKNLCCEDHISSIAAVNYFTPDFYPLTEIGQNHQDHSYLPSVQIFSSEICFASLHTNLYPPGQIKSTDVDLSKICVLRI